MKIMHTNTILSSYHNATRKIDYTFTNDYMFRVLLQKNKRVLKALICSLLHLHPEEIKSIEITNPIEPGRAIDNKEFILDIVILLNNNTLINLEMQVENQLNWQDRSLAYLCRSYDQLLAGQDYNKSKPAIHIGFLNFTPFKDYPEFYASYKLLNIKNHNIYSDKFTLSVVDLTKINLATDEDKTYQIDYWAKLFKSATWEEIKMIAKNNEYLQEASETLYTLNADEMIRQQCQARADYYRLHNAINQKMDELTAENEKLSSTNKELSSEVEALKKLLEENSIPLPSSPKI